METPSWVCNSRDARFHAPHKAGTRHGWRGSPTPGEAAISPYHLLVAILREGEGIAAQLLKVSEVRWEQVGDRVQVSVVSDTAEGPITLPPDFQEALQQHPAARAIFEKLPYSKKKRFVDHIEHAAGEAARSQQVEKAIEILQRVQQNQQP